MTKTSDLLSIILGLFAQAFATKGEEIKSDLMEQMKLLFEAFDVKKVPGAPFTGEEVILDGSLYDFPGLPEVFWLREYYREIVIQAIKRQKELQQALANTANELYPKEQIFKLTAEESETVKSAEHETLLGKIAAEYLPLEEGHGQAKNKLERFIADTRVIRLENDIMYTFLWSAIKARFPGLAGHEMAYGVFGETLKVGWIRKDSEPITDK